MGAFSHIAWTDATWNITSGCTKVSPGCKFCYAKHQSWPRLAKAPGNAYTGREFEDVQFHPERLDMPIRWQRPRKIFVNSLSDLFHEKLTDDQIATVFVAMAMADQHIFQVLTKRSERAAAWFKAHDFKSCLAAFDRTVPRELLQMSSALRRGRQKLSAKNWPLPNVWMGVSAEDQAHYDERLPHLMSMPAAVRWISAEPLLGPIDLRLNRIYATAFSGPQHRIQMFESYVKNALHWVVAGGESGWTPRPMHPDWARSLRDQCSGTNIRYFFKQWGGFRPVAAFADSTEDIMKAAGATADQIVEAKSPYIVVTAAGETLQLPVPEWAEYRMASACEAPWLMKKVHRGAEEDRTLDGKLHQEYPTVPPSLIAALTGPDQVEKKPRAPTLLVPRAHATARRNARRPV